MIYIHYAIQYNIWAITKVWTGFEGKRLLIKVATEIPEYWNEQNKQILSKHSNYYLLIILEPRYLSDIIAKYICTESVKDSVT